MDIARIRKKIKKSKTRDEQKTKQPHSEVEVVSKPDEVKTKAEQERAQKTIEESKAELPELEAETRADRVVETEILAFKIANEEYAVKITDLQEVLRNQRITAVPRSPKYLIGITFVRGKILPVIDLRKRLGLAEKNTGKEKILVLSTQKEPLGALVGAVLGVFRFPSDELLPPPSTLTEKEKGLIEGVVKINSKFISILKVNEIFSMEAL